MGRLRIGVAVPLAAMLAGCGGGAGLSHDVAHNPAEFARPDAPVAVTQEYRIGAADELRIVMFQVPDLSETVTVDATGNLDLPLVGRVPVAGLTPREVQDDLRRRYGATYVQDPQVTVSVARAVSQRITVDGAVAQPGVYPIVGATTLLQAMSLAHGTAPNAVLSRVVVFRRIDGRRRAAAFDLRRIRAGSMADPAVYGDDVVVVDGSNLRGNLHEILQTIPVIALFGAL